MQKPTFIKEINGLRVIAAFIVLSAHYSTVSGLTSGISLFFVITGFLSGAKIKRAVAKGEKLNFWPDLRSTLWRLLLPMHLVLLAVSIWVISSVDVLHRADWLKSIFAMSLGYGNQYEIANASTYWDRATILSPTLSLWAMSVLVQFAIILAVVRFVASRVALQMSESSREIALIILGVFAVLLSIRDALSFDGTTSYQFATINWTWAFLLGLVLSGTSWRFKDSKIQNWIADISFFAILILGILPIFGLEPIGSWVRPAFGLLAIICLLAPSQEATFFQKLLNSKIMQFVGGITFAIYLIHWPIMIVFRYYTDANRDRKVPQGMGQHVSHNPNQMTWYYALGLTLICILLAWLIQKIVNFIIAKVITVSDVKQKIAQFATLAVLPVLVFSLQSANITSGEDIYKNLTPALADASRDSPIYYRTNCESGIVRICRYGDANSETTIAIVGTSTAGQWFDSVIPLADKYGWHVQVMVKEGCTHAQGNSEIFCRNWREEVITLLKEQDPDLVVMETTHSNAGHTKEFVSRRDQKLLKSFALAGIPVMGIRSTPSFSFYVPECIAANADYQSACGIYASNFYLTPNDYQTQVNTDQFVVMADLTSVICPDGFCAPVDKNIIRYVDDKHLTATYSKSLSGEIEPYLLKALGIS
ncbi:MAG: acyltransferase family protein [Actinobacteria bacterium]|nr:acyltransferase family protein [Actinomycetota bacterium]